MLTIIGIPALIGGLIGAGAGGLIGAGVSSAGQGPHTKVVPHSCAYETITLEDVKKMAQSGMSDETIIHTLTTTHTHFYKADLNGGELRMAGVSQKVIDVLYKISM